MQISDKYIIEYQRLYQKRFGKEISRDLAFEQFSKLVTLMKNIYKPISKKDYQKYSNISKDE